MNIETERIVLRDFTIADLDDFHEIFGDAEVMRNTEPPYSREKSEKFLSDFCINRQPKGGFAAILKETGKVIGYVLFKSIDEPEIYEIGWIFNKNYWRKGYAFEICNELIRFGFVDMKLHRICAEATDAEKSVPLMKKLGMTQEGVFKKHSQRNDGTWTDLYWYAILCEDYLKEQLQDNETQWM